MKCERCGNEQWTWWKGYSGFKCSKCLIWMSNKQTDIILDGIYYTDRIDGIKRKKYRVAPC